MFICSSRAVDQVVLRPLNTAAIRPIIRTDAPATTTSTAPSWLRRWRSLLNHLVKFIGLADRNARITMAMKLHGTLRDRVLMEYQSNSSTSPAMTTMDQALVKKGVTDSFAKKPADCERVGQLKTYGAGRAGTLSMCVDYGQRWQKRGGGWMPVNPKETPSSRNPTGAQLATAR